MSLDRKLELEDGTQEGERCDALRLFPGLSLRFNEVSFTVLVTPACGELMDRVVVDLPWGCLGERDWESTSDVGDNSKY